MNTYFDITIKQTYKQGDQDKTVWPKVGRLIIREDGKYFLDMPLLPRLYVFPQTEHNKASAKAADASREPGSDDVPA